MTRTHHYRLYGLHVASERSLDALPLRSAEPATPDVRVLFDTPDAFWDDAVETGRSYRRVTLGETPLQIDRTEHGWAWRYPDDTRFFVSEAGTEIRLRWPEHYVLEDALTYLLGPILGFVLRLRGVRSLHASSVVIDGSAICFVGPRGAGKSTTAAAMATRGHPVLSEDVTALRGGDALPGLPLVKLWEDSAALHGELPLITPNWSKRYLELDERFADRPAPVGVIYVLERGTRPALGATRPAEALATLLNNVYVSYALSDTMRGEDLDFFGDLVDRVPVRRLTRTSSFDDLDSVLDLVERDVAESDF